MQKNSKHKTQNKEYVVYGLHTCKSLLEYEPHRAKKLFLARKDIKDLMDLAQKNGIAYEFVDRDYLEKRFNISSEHQGALIIASLKTYLSDEELFFKKPSTLILLDEVQDPVNLGKMARSALCFGADALVILKDNSVKISSISEKAASGALSRIDVAMITNVASFIKKLKEHNFFVYGADERGEKEIQQVDFAKKTCIVIGREGEGLRSLTKKNCDMLVNIPMSNNDICLNAADAALIFLYQIKISQS